MASATKKATLLTPLVIGKVELAVGLFTTVAKPDKLTEFDTAGPNGGVLKAREIARPVPVGEQTDAVDDAPVFSDPLGSDPGREAPPEFTTGDPRGMTGTPTRPTLDPEACGPYGEVDGQYGRELVEDGSGVVVLPQDVRRGVRLEDGRFIDCTEQLAAIDRQTKLDRMEVVAFVDVTQIPRARVTGTYYVGLGDEEAGRGLRMLYEGLKQMRRVAVVKLTKRTRQSLGVIGWLDGCLMLYELTWAEDFREPPARAARIQKVQVSAQEVDQVCLLIQAMSAPVSTLDALRDDALRLREELKLKALAGEVAEVIVPESAAPADDVMAQLEASLAAVGS